MELTEVTYEVLATGDKMPSGYYMKADVDAVIDEKDKEIAELKAKLEDVNELVKESKELLKESQKMHLRCADNAIKKIRHQKYKRCLAMAKMCDSEENRLEAISPIFDTDKECWEYNSDYWARWQKRWLEIAEKFKEAK